MTDFEVAAGCEVIPFVAVKPFLAAWDVMPFVDAAPAAEADDRDVVAEATAVEGWNVVEAKAVAGWDVVVVKVRPGLR